MGRMPGTSFHCGPAVAPILFWEQDLDAFSRNRECPECGHNVKGRESNRSGLSLNQGQGLEASLEGWPVKL
jgi:hypothetical protein